MHTEALRANLERTAVEVVIPPEHEVLLEISSHLHGVHQATERLLREINHTYVGWVETVPELHRRAMADFYHYNTHERGPQGMAVYGDLYAKAAREAMPEAARTDAMRLWLTYLEKIVTESGRRLGENLAAVDRSLHQIAPILSVSLEQAGFSSARLKRLVAALYDADVPPRTMERAADLLRVVLDQVYAMWLDREDPAAWIREVRSAQFVEASTPDAVAAISHEALQRAREGLAAIGDVAGLLGLPDHASITRGYLDAADVFDGAVDERARWLCRVLGEDLLAPIHDRALWSIARSCRALVAGADRPQFERFVRDVFTTLHAGGTGYGASALDLVRRIGVAVLEGPLPEWADLVIDEILELDFHRPDFAGFTDDWAVRVNPNHLKNIRAHLGIISTDPTAARRLLAALVIHLEVGGVFVADTDLFQKDVSVLLAADSALVYHQVRHLLRRLPVYFSDIGAEGALREVSTRIDEIGGRQDPICHFLRKQSHVESNPMLISVVEEVARFWATGDPSSLRAYLPEELYGALAIDDYPGVHRVLARLAAEERGLDGLFAAPAEEVEHALAEMSGEDPLAREKAGLLFRLRLELKRKYALDHIDVIDRLRGVTPIEQARVDTLQSDLAEGRFEDAIGSLLSMLEDLRRIIVRRGTTEAVEDIYRKRHIGTGIPSMYGRYREERLEAAGLSFRIESLAGSLFDRIVAAEPVGNPTVEALERVSRWLQLLKRALDVEGYGSHSLAMGLSMLDDALELGMVSRAEFVDVLRGISRSVHDIVQGQLLAVYGDLFEALGPGMVARGEVATGDGAADEAIIKACESFLRSLVAESLALQRIDNLSSAVLHALTDPAREWRGSRGARQGAVAANVVRIFDGESPGVLHLGNKGFMLTQLAEFGFPIPDGFILPTALSRARNARTGAGGPLAEAVVEDVREALGALERGAGRRFGDPRDPLLLSVRGGAPISMPGMLDSFLNVGINPEIVEALAVSCGSPWAAWDAYRRFLQFWGMSHGVDRDLFDALMSDAKQRLSVPKKALITPGHMCELAGEYRTLLGDHGIRVVDDPFAQLIRTIELVMDSWDSATAKVYRAEMRIAEGWGTAVTVQNMVYGNLHARSGTGVLLTYHPQRDHDSFELYGDFVIQGQGDDVVSGLTETFPISERQRLRESPDGGASLEHDFPEIYGSLVRAGRSLVSEHGWPHQEIEFTFESERPEDLFILQSREAVGAASSAAATFVSTTALSRSWLASGIGVGGGAMSCRVALNEADIARLRVAFPSDPVLLVRPDTVPDDIHLLVQADALLTAIGGGTSHAAVVARRLGKTCVVGCRRLRVFEESGRIEVGGCSVDAGDVISISGIDGSIYLGSHDVEAGKHAGTVTARIGANA